MSSSRSPRGAQILAKAREGIEPPTPPLPPGFGGNGDGPQQVAVSAVRLDGPWNLGFDADRMVLFTSPVALPFLQTHIPVGDEGIQFLRASFDKWSALRIRNADDPVAAAIARVQEVQRQMDVAQELLTQMQDEQRRRDEKRAEQARDPEREAYEAERGDAS